MWFHGSMNILRDFFVPSSGTITRAMKLSVDVLEKY
jgi:hypothetical protein